MPTTTPTTPPHSPAARGGKPPPSPEPWPMKWIVLALLPCLAAYTFVTLQYRKPGHAFEPYSDLKERAQIHQLLEAGFQRIELQALGADSAARSAANAVGTSSAGPGAPSGSGGPLASREAAARVITEAAALPEALRAALLDAPQLIAQPTRIFAPEELSTAQPLRLGFEYRSKVEAKPAGAPLRATLYIRGNQLFLVPELVAGAGAASSASAPAHTPAPGARDSVETSAAAATNAVAATELRRADFTADAGLIKPGHYEARLIGAEQSLAWTLHVR